MTLSLSISYLFFVEVAWTVYLYSFLVEGGWENAQRVWFRALLNSNSLISKLFVLWRSILRKRVPYADLNPYVLNHSLRNIYFLQVTIIDLFLVYWMFYILYENTGGGRACGIFGTIDKYLDEYHFIFSHIWVERKYDLFLRSKNNDKF